VTPKAPARLTVLFDSGCVFCRRCRAWLQAQRALVPLEFVPAGSTESRSRFKTLRQGDPPDELIVVDDGGGVYRGADAWIMCLYALEDYRAWSIRLASPGLRGLSRAGFALLSSQRHALSHLVATASDERLAALLSPPALPEMAGDRCQWVGGKK
jgi:predicted DCC family thiol-disulfide oxidoreductase YuxK